ncbi:helix-hairpin-helix domain-containing protein [Streptomyces sp. SS8]
MGASRRARLAEAVRDRLPLWVRTRCGVEPRTLAALALALAVALGFALHHFWGGRPQVVQAPPVESASRSTPVPSQTSASVPSSVPAPAAAPGTVPGAGAGGGALLVDVAGEVRRPGVHRLPAGARVTDALRAAGGVRPGTDLHGLNRARPLADGEQIVVGEPPTEAAAPGPPAAGAVAGGGPAAGGPVSLNSATAEQLDALPGIGPVMAQRIIDHRTEHGGFSSVEELREVSGIGERRFAELKPLVVP